MEQQAQVVEFPTVADASPEVQQVVREAQRMATVGQAFAEAPPAERDRLLRWVNAAFREGGGRGR